MEGNIKDFGKTANNMAKENFIIKKKKAGKKAFGAREDELNGKIITLLILCSYIVTAKFLNLMIVIFNIIFF